MIRSVLVSSCVILVLFLSSFDSYYGIVPLLQENFNINDAQVAIIRTSSSTAQTITLAVVWLFGDVFEQNKLFLASVSIWIMFSLLSLVLGSASFMMFVSFRAIGAAASAVFGVLVPVMLADLFHDRALCVALMCMTTCNTIGGIFTRILDSWIVSSGAPWQSVLLLGPLLSIIPLVLLLFSERAFRGTEQQERRSIRRSFTSAFRLFSIKSYLLMTASLSLGGFYMMAMGFWLPSTLLSAWTAFPDAFLGLSYTTITAIESVVTQIGTFTGLPIILWLAQSWRHGTGPFSGKQGYGRAYPIVVSMGAALNAGMFILAMLLLVKSYAVSMVAIFFAGIGTAADFSLSQQMMLMVVPSGSRAAAVALSRLVTGAVSAPAAQLIGMASDAFRGDSTLPADRFYAYQFGLLCASAFMVACILCDVIVVFYFPGDCRIAEEGEDQTEIDDCTPLIGTPKFRSESLLETIVRSRGTTASASYSC